MENWDLRLHSIDHSVPGSVAVEVLSPSGQSLLYTGDWHAHGWHPETLRNLSTALRKVPDLMLCEGTTLGRAAENVETESELAASLATRLAKVHGPIWGTLLLARPATSSAAVWP